MIEAEPREARVPAALLPYQQRWVGDKSPVKIAEKSRRVGFSWAAAAESALEAAYAKGSDVWYIGYSKDMAIEFIRDCAEWVGHYGRAAVTVEEEVIEDGDDGEKKNILAFVIRFASGFRITALSSRPTNLRGKQGLVILDEFAFHNQKKELLKAALALIMWGGRVAIISTHDGIDNEFNELIGEVKTGKKAYSLHRVTFDDALRDGLYKRISLRLNTVWTTEAESQWREQILDLYGEDADEELHVIPKASGGAYLARGLIEQRMYEAPVLRIAMPDAFVHEPDAIRESFIHDWCETQLKPLLDELPKDMEHVFGEDFGRSGDLTVIAPAIVMQNLVLRCPFIIEERNMPFRQQEQILFYVVDRLPRLRGGALDSRGNGQHLGEYALQRYGSARILTVMLSDKWYSENIPRFKDNIESALWLFPRDADIVTDLRAFEMVRGIPKLADAKRKGKDGGQRHGDAAIALALCDAASRIEAGPIEYQTAGPRESSEMTRSGGRTDFRGF